MKKAEVKPEKESTNAAETLDQITEEWIEKQRSRIKNTPATCCKKSFSDSKVLELLKNMMYKKRQFGDILSRLRLYIPNITELLKNMCKDFVHLIEAMLRIERYENKAEKKS